ncbi:MAG: anion permease [bacterium]
MDLLIPAFIFSFILAYANSANDVSKSVATLVGSGVTDYRKALLWGTIWTVAGSFMASIFALKLVLTFTNGWIANSVEITTDFPIAVLLGSMAWVLLASKFGAPVSTTHAITGALCSTGIFVYGVDKILWTSLGEKIFLPLALSPVLASALVFLFIPLCKLGFAKWGGACLCIDIKQVVPVKILNNGFVLESQEGVEVVNAVVSSDRQCNEESTYAFRLNVDTLHWLSSGAASIARGLNDAPKIVALGISLMIASGNSMENFNFLNFIFVSVGMGLGSYLSGLKVTEVLAERVTKMNHLEGFSANFITALLVTIAARLGLPVSTTHVSSGAIIGIGFRKGVKGVYWKTVREMVLAWIVTLPAAGILAVTAFNVLKFFF